MAAADDSPIGDAGRFARTMALRAIGLTALFGVELVSLISVYRAQALPDAAITPLWIDVNATIMKAALLSLNVGSVIAVALVLVNWTHRQNIIASWGQASLSRAWRPWVLANLGVFAIALLGALALNRQYQDATSPPWGLFSLWCVGASLLAPTLVLAFAPVRYWVDFVQSQRTAIVVATLAAVIASLFMLASERSWGVLSDWTLSASVWTLQLYEHDLSYDISRNIVRVGAFGVLIGAPCSGFQGIGLVTTFLSLFLWAFRNDLKFPNALLIIPIGMVAVWCLNVLRIVTLISIGAHFSPDIALGGFHDHAGWLMFLITSISLMFMTYRVGFFRANAVPAPKTLDPGVRLACAYLLPFIAIMAAGIIAKTFSEDAFHLYPLSVAAGCAAMWPFRDIYLKLIARPQIASIVAGLAIGVAWIATDPGRGATSTLWLWLESLPAWAAISWICVRFIGTSVFVPIAEELAFRGYLHRALIARQFESVEPRQFTWLAFLVSTALFALMHQRWLSAAIAGAIYALVMYRTNRVSDAIVAHAASNAMIAAWAVCWGQWSLL